MSAVVTVAREALDARIRELAERPTVYTVAQVIDRRMAVYAGRDPALVQRLATWRQILGTYTLGELTADHLAAARMEIAGLPALNFKGKDHEGRPIFRAKHAAKAKAPATVNNYMAALSGVFTWAIEERLAPRGWMNPCRGVRYVNPRNERVRFLDDEERARLLEACRSSRYPRLLALVTTAMFTGARRGELLSLTWADVDLEARRAYLGRTKNGDRRQLVLLPQVVQVLSPIASHEAKRYVFGSVKSRFQKPASIDTAWRIAVKRAGIADLRFHDLRHTCASYLVQNGTDLAVVAAILGHRQLSMSRRYAHLKTENLEKAMQAALGRIAA